MRDFKAKKGSLKSKTERRLAKWLYGIGRCCLFGKLSASRRCSVACRFGKDFRLPQSWQQQPIAPHAIQAQVLTRQLSMMRELLPECYTALHRQLDRAQMHTPQPPVSIQAA